MEQIRACRICLITGVRMNDLRCYPLLNYFESMDGMSPLDNMDLPPYACYECAAYIRKTYWFRERCLRGQETLYTMLSDNGEITEKSINKIDRLHLGLSSNMKTILLEHSINLIYEDEQVYGIKYEDGQYEKEDNIQDEKEEIVLDFFKDELDLNDLGSPAQIFSDEDNEPLSFHKSNKEKDVKKKLDKKKGRKKLEIVIEKIEYADVATESAAFEVENKKMQSTELLVHRRKRGRPRKNEVAMSVKKERPERRTKNTGGVDDNDIDLEEYVTIIKLTKKEQMDEIEKRKESSNYLNAPYKCSLCFKGFIDTAAWQHHVSKHQPTPGDLECPICKFRFKTKRNLQKHSSNHEKKYACKSCSYVSKTTTQAKQHQRWHKGVTYKCQYCDEVSTKWTSYLSHVRIKHPSEFICGACGYSFVSQLGLNMHKTMMHKQLQENEGEKSDSGPYCAVCDVKFLGVEAYRRHMVTSAKHTQNNDFKNGCRVCGETFSNGEELRLHHRRMHARARPKNYGKKPANTTWPADCEHCGESIPNARDFWTHFRRAHPDKPYPIQKNYVCDICGKSFRGNAFLVYHKRTHTEERAYKCAQCPKAFFNRTNLQMHEKTHSDHRPYPCSVCFKAFKCKGALDRHFRSHTGVKPYECEVCGKAFGQSNSRKLHVRTVHLKQPAPYISRARLERTRKLPAKEQTHHPLY